MKAIAKQLAALIIMSAATHWLWEVTHFPLYISHLDLSGWTLYLWAVGGDVLITLVIWSGMAFIKQDLAWLRHSSVYDFMTIAVIGFLFAMGIEYRALALGRWEYALAMPIIPYFLVGLSPILQMTLLTPLNFWLVKKL